MKKFALYIISVILLLSLGSCTFSAEKHTGLGNVEAVNEQERYFRKINEIIKDMDFFSATAEDGRIMLYDRERNLISEIPFEEYDKSQKFIYARKSDNIIYFITSAAVDDESGIMFVNDGSDSMMDGIGSASRIGGNSYAYDTFCKLHAID